MRPHHICGFCGRPTQSRQGVCASCYYTARHQRANPDDGLRGGRWVRRGLVHVWTEELEGCDAGHDSGEGT